MSGEKVMVCRFLFLEMPIFEADVQDSRYSSLPNSTHQGIIRTDVGTPTLGFLFSPRFSIFPTLGYYSALGFLFLPP